MIEKVNPKADQPDENGSEDGPQLTILEHLEELRSRLVKAGLALIVCTVLSLAFTRYVLELLIRPMGDAMPVALRPTETIIIYFKIALISGLVFSMPIILYQMARFVLPGLTPSEQRYIYILVPAGSLLFAIGVAFAGTVMLPFAIKYLQGFLADLVAPTYSIDYYISFVTTMLFWVGLVFETPLIIAFLARVGVVSPQFLSKNRRYAIVLIAILSAMITPTPDPVNMTLVMLPLLALYEVGVILAKLTYRPRQAPAEETTAKAGSKP